MSPHPLSLSCVPSAVKSRADAPALWTHADGAGSPGPGKAMWQQQPGGLNEVLVATARSSGCPDNCRRQAAAVRATAGSVPSTCLPHAAPCLPHAALSSPPPNRPTSALGAPCARRRPSVRAPMPSVARAARASSAGLLWWSFFLLLPSKAQGFQAGVLEPFLGTGKRQNATLNLRQLLPALLPEAVKIPGIDGNGRHGLRPWA